MSLVLWSVLRNYRLKIIRQKVNDTQVLKVPQKIIEILAASDFPSHYKEEFEEFFHSIEKEKKRRDFIIERLSEDKKITQNFLNKTVQDLEGKNHELSKILAEKQAVNDKLIAINQELEEFAFIISHDLQEPLRTILNFADLLRNTRNDDLDRETLVWLDFIFQSSIRMSNQIRAILEYSRIGKSGEKEWVDCNHLIQDVVSDLSSAIRDKKAEIHVHTLPKVYGNPSELYSLFQNLLINALKYSKRNIPPQIWIEYKTKGEYYLFTITDNGIGIKAEHHERIFVIFQRLHRLEDLEGSGIGLSRCKKIVEVHSGKIWVESVPGEGSTFHFTLPTKYVNE